jgi:glycine dehydrogenase subunit 2
MRAPHIRTLAGTPRLDLLPTPEDEGAGHLPVEQRRESAPDLSCVDEGALLQHMAALAGDDARAEGAAAERALALPALTRLHPQQPAATVQGALEVFHEVARTLSALTGIDRFSLQPPTLAAAERAALHVAHASFSRTQAGRNEVAAPEGSSALDTARDLGLEARPIARLTGGEIDLDSLMTAVGPATVAVATAWLASEGRFERNLSAAAEVTHMHGALLCVDASGLRHLAGHTRLSDAGADVAWLSLSELCLTATSAAVGVSTFLTEFLPGPLVAKSRSGYELDHELPGSIGPLALAPGHLADALRAWVALRLEAGS